MDDDGGETTAATTTIRKPYTLPNHPSTSHQLPSLPNTIPQICSHLHRLIQSQALATRSSSAFRTAPPPPHRKRENLPRPLLRRQRQHRHDQIILAEFLTLVPSNSDEYSARLPRLTASQLHTRTVRGAGETKTGTRSDRRGELRGSPREHAGVSGSGGAKSVVAQSS
ncbi:hypothetical protein Bca52824_001923 [Brassica carinata]|uniref:Uncharacterized protein n=1 Tax=Brassica carinata TaxID=52824 RepID=A0A8X8BDU5_BRACI|nr:hypothetical protein Bca52824_001923 [Brassica carinata]